MKQKQKYLRLTDIYDMIITKSHQPIHKFSLQISNHTSKKITNCKNNFIKPECSSSQSFIKNHQSSLQLTNLNLINGPSTFYINDFQPFYSVSPSQSVSNALDQISLASQRNKLYFQQSHDHFLEHQHDKKGIYLTKKKLKGQTQQKMLFSEDDLPAEPIAQQKIAKKVRYIFK